MRSRRRATNALYKGIHEFIRTSTLQTLVYFCSLTLNMKITSTALTAMPCFGANTKGVTAAARMGTMQSTRCKIYPHTCGPYLKRPNSPATNGNTIPNLLLPHSGLAACKSKRGPGHAFCPCSPCMDELTIESSICTNNTTTWASPTKLDSTYMILNFPAKPITSSQPTQRNHPTELHTTKHNMGSTIQGFRRNVRTMTSEPAVIELAKLLE